MKRSTVAAALVWSTLSLTAALPGWSAPGDFANADAGERLVEDGLALSGYDAVSYIEDRQAIRGQVRFSTELDGARYRFASKRNLDRFLAEPERYLPAFGGWCAFGFAMDAEEFAPWKPGKYPVDPQTFKIIDGRLHLFFNQDGFNGLDAWNRDEPGNLERAREVWAEMHGAPPEAPE